MISTLHSRVARDGKQQRFHYAGVKEQNVTLGLPRLIDTRNTQFRPLMSYFTPHPITILEKFEFEG